MVEIDFGNVELNSGKVIAALETLSRGRVHELKDMDELTVVEFLKKLGLVDQFIQDDQVYYSLSDIGFRALWTWRRQSPPHEDRLSSLEKKLFEAYTENSRITHLLESAADVILKIAETGDAGLAAKHIEEYTA